MPTPRRRREKKLMTMEDVNARFPLTKYKLWRASRENQGLPANGGVTAPPSRAASIKEAIGLERTSTEDPSLPHHKEIAVHTPEATGSGQYPISSDRLDFAGRESSGEGPSSPTIHEKPVALPGPYTTSAPSSTAQHETSQDDDVDEDDPIRTAVPTELLAEPGDSCAICIDTLEDDDEVRGLTCGHAFHASCLDPWLTSRRACCPLCKADYYVPKPRPEGEAPQLEQPVRQLVRPANAWVGGRYLFANSQPGESPSHMLIGGTRFTIESDRYGFPVLTRGPRANRRERRSRRSRPAATEPQSSGGATEPVTQPAETVPAAPQVQAPPAQSSWFRNAFVNTERNVPRLPTFGRRREPTTQPGSEAPASVTPAQLEAGAART